MFSPPGSSLEELVYALLCEYNGVTGHADCETPFTSLPLPAMRALCSLVSDVRTLLDEEAKKIRTAA